MLRPQLMKLNEEWDQVYHNATMRLQHRMEALELENVAIKQLNSRLLLKVEHQQVSAAHGSRNSTKEEREQKKKIPNQSKAESIDGWRRVTDGTFAGSVATERASHHTPEVSVALLCAECKGVLRAGADAGAEEEPGAAGVPPPAGEQAAPAQEGRRCRQTGSQQLSLVFLTSASLQILSCSSDG